MTHNSLKLGWLKSTPCRHPSSLKKEFDLLMPSQIYHV